MESLNKEVIHWLICYELYLANDINIIQGHLKETSTITVCTYLLLTLPVPNVLKKYVFLSFLDNEMTQVVDVLSRQTIMDTFILRIQ